MSHRTRSSSERTSNSSAKIGLVAGALLVVGAFNGYQALADTSPETTCTVTGHDRTTERNGGSDMRVYTAECGTFRVADNWFAGHFASADVFGSIQDGQAYTFETRGGRIPVLSSFPNIVSVTPVG